MTTIVRGAVIEDDRDTLRNLSEVWAAYNSIDYSGRIVSSTKELRTIIRNRRFPVHIVSIDWEVNGIDVGYDIIDWLVDYQPWAGRVVYTQHAELINDALQYGADYVLLKNANYEEYQEVMQNATRLGVLRRIYWHLERSNNHQGLVNILNITPRSEDYDVSVNGVIQRAIDRIHDGNFSEDIEEVKILTNWMLRYREDLRMETLHVSSREIDRYLSGNATTIDIDMLKAHLNECLECYNKFKLLLHLKPIQVINKFEGVINRVSNGIAYVTLTDKLGRSIQAKYDAEHLKVEGIHQGDYVVFLLEDRGNETALSFHKSVAPNVSDSELNEYTEEIAKKWQKYSKKNQDDFLDNLEKEMLDNNSGK